MRTKLRHLSRFRIMETFFLLFLASLSIWLRNMTPINPFFYNKHDDALMVRLASNLISMNWLGTWDNLTLAKPPGYPFYLFAAHYLGISPIIGVHLILIFCGFLIYIALKNIEITFILRGLVYILIIFNPIFYGAESSRIYRDSLIGALFLLIFSQTFYILTKLSQGTIKKSDQYIHIISTSLVIGYITIMKEDLKLWGAPLLIFSIIGISIILDRKQGHKYYQNTIVSFVILLVTVFSINLIIITQNNNYYGVKTLQDSTSGSFSLTYKLLASLPGKKDLNYVYVDRNRRALAYSVSPTFNSLSRAIENPFESETNWRSISCSFASICEDAGPWFNWQLRDAAYIELEKKTAISYNAFFNKINSELNQYCSESKKCSTKPLSIMLPPANIFEARVLFNSYFKMTNSIMNFDSANPNRQNYFTTSESDLRLWRETIHGIEVYWQDEPNKYNQESSYLQDYVVFFQNIFIAIFPIILILCLLLFRFNQYTNLKILFFITFVSVFLHLSLLSYADSHAGAIGLGRTTYLLESLPIFYGSIFIFFAIGINSLRNLFTLQIYSRRT